MDPKTEGQEPTWIREVSGGEGAHCQRNQQATHLTMPGLFRYIILRTIFSGWAMLQKEKLRLQPAITPARSWAWIQTWMFRPESNFFLPTPHNRAEESGRPGREAAVSVTQNCFMEALPSSLERLAGSLGVSPHPGAKTHRGDTRLLR